MTWIQTHSGQCVDLVDIDPDTLQLEDMCWALAHTNRFGGHALAPWSVAAHSMLVAELLQGTEHYLGGLVHDLAEAYLGDIPGPIKHLCTDYGRLEANMEYAIRRRFGLPERQPEVYRADVQALMIERDALMFGGEVKPWNLRVVRHPCHDSYVEYVRGAQGKSPSTWADCLHGAILGEM